MFLQFEVRKSTSPFVERIWRCQSRTGGPFLSMAEGNIELVITRLPGFLAVTLRGPVSKGSLYECPPDGEWLAIRFRLGTYLPRIPTAALIDHQDVQLPVLANRRFWFGDLTWEIPDYENAEVFVDRLARRRHCAKPCDRCRGGRRRRLDEPAIRATPFSPRHRYDLQQLPADPARTSRGFLADEWKFDPRRDISSGIFRSGPSHAFGEALDRNDPGASRARAPAIVVFIQNLRSSARLFTAHAPSR
jgi:hypothetical protein